MRRNWGGRDLMAGSARRTLGPYGPRDEDGPPATARSPLQPYHAQPYHARPDRTGGATGNERLTAATGAVLLVLFAAEGFTILSIHQLITVHFFLGMLLIGPVLLKAAAVCYRFVRYYTGARGRPPRCSGCSGRWCWAPHSACWAPG
jgi:hypothetical protein